MDTKPLQFAGKTSILFGSLCFTMCLVLNFLFKLFKTYPDPDPFVSFMLKKSCLKVKILWEAVRFLGEFIHVSQGARLYGREAGFIAGMTIPGNSLSH